MKIDINANSLKKLVRVLRELSDQLENLYTDKKHIGSASNSSVISIVKDKPLIKATSVKKTIEENTHAVAEYYKKLHPLRERALGPKHKSWAIIKKRLSDGYSADELKTAILNNSKDEFFKKNRLHGIKNIMGSDSNLDRFIQKEIPNAKCGYSSGSKQFNEGLEEFGD